MPTENVYKENTNYAVTCTDQYLTTDAKGNVKLVLTVQILGVAKNPTNLNDLDACPNQTRDISLGLEGSNKMLEIRLKELAHLGFPGTDFERLDPNHSNPFSFVGKKFVAFVNNSGYWGIKIGRGRVGQALTDDQSKSFHVDVVARLKELAAEQEEVAQTGRVMDPTTGETIKF